MRSREPLLCQAVGCYLCGKDFGCKEELVKHWRYNHLSPAELQAELRAPSSEAAKPQWAS